MSLLDDPRCQAILSTRRRIDKALLSRYMSSAVSKSVASRLKLVLIACKNESLLYASENLRLNARVLPREDSADDSDFMIS